MGFCCFVLFFLSIERGRTYSKVVENLGLLELTFHSAMKTVITHKIYKEINWDRDCDKFD